VPIDPENAENFDPVDGVPTVSQLLTDLDQSDVKQSTADMQVSRAGRSLGQVQVHTTSTVISKAKWPRPHDMHFRPVSNLGLPCGAVLQSIGVWTVVSSR